MLDKTNTAPLYFVEIDLGKLGNVFVETDRTTNSRAGIIDSLMSCEWDRPLRVLEVREDEGTCRDVSEDIASEICDRVVDGADLPSGGCFNFCEEYLGCHRMADLSRDIQNA